MGNLCQWITQQEQIRSSILTDVNPLRKSQSSDSEGDIYLFEKLSYDRRVFITPSEMKMDYSNIGFINFKTKVTKLNFNATGVLISDTLVLTSAHTFINRSDIEQTVELCEPVRFHYRLHGNYAKEAEYEIEAYRVNEIYKSIMLQRQGDEYHTLNKTLIKDLIGHDYALIKLKKPVQSATFPTILQNYQLDVSNPMKSVAVFGYSQNHLLINEKQELYGARILSHRNEIIKIQNNYIIHNVDTSKGQSGSPIFLNTRSVGGDSGLFCIGLHSGYFLSEARQNYGTLFSSSVIQRLKQWQNELDPAIKSFNIHQIIDKRLVPIEHYEREQSILSVPIPVPESIVKKLSLVNHRSFQSYKEFKVKFDMITNTSSYYSVLNNRVKRKVDLSFWDNKPFHLVNKTEMPKGKWIIRLKVLSYRVEEIIVIGFMNQYRKLETDFSGIAGEKECISLCVCQKSENIKKQGAILVDGNVEVRSEQLFLQPNEGVLSIYVNMDERKIYWSFGKEVVYESHIPQSIETDKMLFFVGLNHTSEEIEILT